MCELDRGMDNSRWIWIIVLVLLFSGGLGSGNFFDQLKCSNNSWIWILALIFLFGDGFFK